MPRIWKRVKKYERWVLLAIVIIVLATFSVSGQCSRTGVDHERGSGRDTGGSFEAAQGKRESVSSDEFESVFRRYRVLYNRLGPTLRWGEEYFASGASKERLSDEAATWAHVATVGAARAAGYEVGVDEIRNGVRKFVERITQGPNGRGGQAFSPELYERVLSVFRIDRVDFETTIGEILLKDKYLAPLVDGARFTKDKAEAFEAWKAEKERVDLEFVAVASAQFADRVKPEEETRSAVSRQSTAFDKLVAAKYDIRRISDVVENVRKASGALPKDTAALLESESGKRQLSGKMPFDSWGKPAAGSTPMEPGKPYVYAVTGTTFTVTSSGPDRKEGTADDVDRNTVQIIDSLTALRRTADALVAWHGTTDSWPATLADLTKVPPPAKDRKAAPAPLSVVPKDAWDREFVYEAAGPVLLSLGADGQRATTDDLVATVGADRSKVPVPASLAPFLEEGLKDAWGRALDIQLGHANPVSFESRSAGPDGEFGTADDLTTGNDIDLRAYFNRYRIDYRLPERRHFEALYVVPCLVPDATLAEAWKKLPEFRPTEQAAFDFFRSRRGATYVTSKKGEGATPGDVDVDPADPKDGNGVALIEALKANGTIPADAKPSLVPSAEAFGEQGSPPPPKPGQPDPAATDPLWKVYTEKGWRRIVLRDLFFENLVNDALTKCRTANDAHVAWVKNSNTGAEPPLVKFDAQLERFKEFQPGEVDWQKGARFLQYFATKPDAPLSRDEWEKLPELGDVDMSIAINRLKEGDYAAIPTLLRNGTIHAAFHVTKVEPSREPDIDEIRGKIFPPYLESQAVERAAKELDLLTVKLKDKSASLADVVAAAAKDRSFTYTIGRTGPFVGPIGARRALVPEDGASDETKAEYRRRNYVRKYGYDVVKSTGGRDEPTTAAVGTPGRKVLRDDDKGDDATHSVYLVRVAWAEDPSPEEFHGKDFANWLSKSTGTGSESDAESRKSGTIMKQVALAFDDWEGIRRLFVIETNSKLAETTTKLK